MLNENTPTLETERLILRKFTKEDIAAYFDIVSDEKANTYLPWFAAKTMEDAQLLLQKNFLDYYSKPSAYKYAVCLKENNIPVGYCVFSGPGSHDIGYGLKPEFWGRGIITQAAAAMVERIKNAGYPFITATHDINNPASGKVMEKLGMKYKYSYVESWQPKNFPVTFRMYQLNFTADDDYTYMEYYNKYENHFVEENV